VHLHVATTLLDHAVHGGEAEPGAAAERFRREERLEDVLEHAWRDPLAGVFDDQRGVGTCFWTWRARGRPRRNL